MTFIYNNVQGAKAYSYTYSAIWKNFLYNDKRIHD